MGIDAVWKDETGRELERLDDPQMLLSGFVRTDALSRTLCLRFLDPYGDACFNQLQLPILTEELEAAAARATARVKEHLLAVARLTRRAEDVHTYVWFVGD